MMVATTRRVQKRMGGDEGGNDGGTGTLLEINRNVTIFQQPLPVPLASFSGIFLHSVNRAPSARPSLVSLSPSRPPGRYAGGKNGDTRERRVVTCAGRWKKTASEIPTGGGRWWRPLCTYKGTKQVAGVTVKNRGLYVREAAKGRNEPSR